MKIAVIGNGSIGMRHANNLLRMKHSVLVIDSDSAKTSSGTLTKQLSGHDAAVICVPTNQHLSVLRKCLIKGLPTYIEKPVGHHTQLSEWRKLLRTEHLPLIMVGYQLRFHRDIQQWIKKRGKQSTERRVFNQSSGQLESFCDMSTWRGRSGKGNFLLEMSHEIDLAMYLGAGVLTSSVSEAKRRYAFMSFNGGWSVELSGASRGYRRSWILKSRDAEATFQYQNPESLGNEMYEASMRHFLNAVKRKRRITQGCTLSQAIDVLDAIKSIERTDVKLLPTRSNDPDIYKKVSDSQ